MSTQVYHLAFSFLEQEPVAAARLLEQQQPDEVANFLANTPINLCRPILSAMLPEHLAQLLSSAEPTARDLWLNELNNHVLSAALRYLDGAQRTQLLQCLPAKKRSACELLLNYRGDMVGAWVETDIPVFPGDMTAEETQKRLRRRGYRESHCIFVIDHARHLTGTLSVVDLLRASAATTLDSLARAVPASLSGRSSLSAALRHPLWQSQDLATVVNAQRELIGAIWYSRLRYLLSAAAKPWRHSGIDVGNIIMDLASAHGESMRGLADIFVNDNR